MQERFESFEALENKLLDLLCARGCSSITITGYRYLCNSVISWLQDNGFDSYTKEGGDAFLERYEKTHGRNQYYAALRTVVYRLNDITDNTWKDVHSDKGKKFYLSEEFTMLINKYCIREADAGLADGSIKNKRYASAWFLHELTALHYTSFEQLPSSAIALACIKITNHSLWGEIGVFLRYLVESGEVNTDYSIMVPHYSKPYVIPSVYSIDEIKRIENSIDTSTIHGKRDYAIILLASRMGLRSGDIVKLRIDDVKNSQDINIIQEKTGNCLHLPLIREVMLAIEDYLTVRPSSATNKIFINVYAPYNAITTGTIRNVMKKCIAATDIKVENRKKGPHVLRSSLASSMVNDDISYETVRKVLGHSSNNAIKHYARIDVEKLRPYCLEPPKVSGKFKAFLQGEVM